MAKNISIDEFIRELNSAEDVNEIKKVGVALAESLDCDYFLYAGIGQLPISSPQVTLVGNYPEVWMKRYQEKEYARIDPTIWHATHEVTPLLWCDVEIANDTVASFFLDAKSHFFDAKSHGVISGATIPLHSGAGYSAIMSLVSTSESDGIYKVLQAKMPQIFLFGYHLHNVVMKRLEIDAGFVRREPLSEPEKDCLLWAAEGKTSWEIAQILSIKERTVVFHLNNAGKKLGAINRQHTIACAIALGEIRASNTTIPDKYKFV